MRILLMVLAMVMLMGCTVTRQKQITTSSVWYENNTEESILFKKPKPKPKISKERQLDEFVEVNNERRRLPYQDNGQWNYTNIQTGKPVNTSHKLSL